MEITRTSAIYSKHVNRELRGVWFKVDIRYGQRLSQQFRYGIHGPSFLLPKRQGPLPTLAYDRHALPLSFPVENRSFSPRLKSIGGHT